ncbi:hypothetical protein B0H10DRAFT_1944629 [Mycena sp. CBHHK59/15]|nr:hypothetical protein B0H10DRAFT_1944629 [Mycena sp. CBHHK59/15]
MARQREEPRLLSFAHVHCPAFHLTKLLQACTDTIALRLVLSRGTGPTTTVAMKIQSETYMGLGDSTLRIDRYPGAVPAPPWALIGLGPPLSSSWMVNLNDGGQSPKPSTSSIQIDAPTSCTQISPPTFAASSIGYAGSLCNAHRLPKAPPALGQ